MSDANRMNLAYIEEVTYGTAPVGSALQNVRYTSESLRADTGTVNSSEIRSDRNIVGVIRNSFNAAGDVNWELSYSAHDPWFEAAFLSADWTTPITDVVADTSISFDAASNEIRDVGVSGTFINYTAGNYIHVTGASNAANNGYFRITAINDETTALTDNIIVVAPTSTLVNEAASAAITITEGGYITTGTEFRSFTIEKEYEDLTNEFALLTGMAIDGMTISVAADALVTGSFTWLGQDSASAAATTGTGTNTAAPTNDIMNAIDDIPFFRENDAEFSITGYTFTLANNLRNRLQVGTLGPISLGTGSVELTGTVQAYFEDNAVLDRYLNFSDNKLHIVFEKTSSQAYLLDLPKMKFTGGQRVAGGINTDIIADMTYSAFLDSTAGYAARLYRFTS